MSTAAEHYKQLLAEHYLWMFGMSFEEKVAEQNALLKSALGSSANAGAAVDLGSGPGFQSMALAELGYGPVFAIDSSPELLLEVSARKGAHAIQAMEADLTALSSMSFSDQPAVVVCMGDTLSHLPSKTAVEDLFKAVSEKIAVDGVFVITYRDLSGDLAGLDRFFLVREDDSKILTCFLEYRSADAVTVHDLLYLREAGAWRLKKSAYEKCRLPVAWVKQVLLTSGFAIEKAERSGSMTLIVARKNQVSA